MQTRERQKWKALVTLTLTKEAPSKTAWSWPSVCREVKWVTGTNDHVVTLWVDVETPEDLARFIGSNIKKLNWVSAVHTAWQQDDWAA